ncbi:MAG: DUF4974 domain-containing protein [Saprospiraceae bacterium]|nr:DUF4974 domain-containing protein [Saprospiraceae bacterium]
MERELFKKLVIKDLSGELDEQETQELRTAVLNNPDLAAEQSIMKKIWNGAAVYDEVPPASSVDQAWSRFSDQAFVEEKGTQPVHKMWSPLMRVAAAVAILVTCFAAWFMLSYNESETMIVANMETETKQVVLPDGSLVDLDQGSSLTYESSFDVRKVELKGSGFFEVVHRSDKDPFSVHATETITTVLGTSFGVMSSEKGVEVYVKTGKVAFEHPSSSERVVLTPTNAASYDIESNKISSIAEATANHLSWQTNILKFDNASFRKILTDLERHFDVHFDVENDRILDCPYRATFENVGLGDVLEDLSFGLNLTFDKKSEDVYMITGKGCPN